MPPKKKAAGIRACIMLLPVLPSCTSGPESEPVYGETCQTEIIISTGTLHESRSADPQENLLTDINLFIFNDRGILEASMYLKAGQMDGNDGKYSVEAELLTGAEYSFYALANAGYAISPENMERPADFKYYLAYPDEYKSGIPMSGTVPEYTVRSGQPVSIELERTMSKISLRIDRSRLDRDVKFIVNSVRIGGCPKYVTPFSKSSVNSGFDTFITGFSKSDGQVAPLNEDTGTGKSREVAVYMFENMQGDLLDGTESDRDKVFPPGDPRADICSYIEIQADYMSDTHYTIPGEQLIYRFYLGESRRNFDVRRNTHYHITVSPEKDGLSENSWRVDQSGLGSYSPYYMKVYPGTFIRGKVDESFHIRCEYYPLSASFDIGIEELEFDKGRGIYDYETDPDGRGVTLRLKKRGSGMLYFETGHPINQSEIVTVIVE